MMFWPVFIAMPTTGALVFYEGDGGSQYAYGDRTTCELQLPRLAKDARGNDDFMDAVESLKQGGTVAFEQKCVDQPPLDYSATLRPPAPDDRI